MSDSALPLNVLLVEDSQSDAELNLAPLERDGWRIDWRRVETPQAFRRDLAEFAPDVVLSAHTLPSFTSLEAVQILRLTDADTPFILVASTMGEESAAALMRAGASDYVLKSHRQRLAPAVRRSLHDAQARRERRQAARALRRSEARYRSLAQASAQIVWWTDAQGRMRERQPIWSDATGQSGARARGLGWLRALHPDDIEAVAATWQQALADGSLYRSEHRLRMGDGNYRWIDVRAAPVRDDNGDIVEWIAAGNDITQAKEREHALQASEARYRALFESALDGILVMRDGRIVDCNPRALTIFACTRGELLGQTLLSLSAPVQPNGNTAPSLLERCNRALAAGCEQDFEWRCLRPDGGEVDTEVRMNPVDLGRGSYSQAIVRDIGRRVRADEERRKLSQAIEQSAEAIFITDVRGVIEYVNPAFERITGYRREELVDRTPRMLASGRHDRTYFRKLWKTVLSGKAFDDVLINRRKNGELYTEEKSITPLKNARGDITHFISTGRDITEQLNVQERLARLAYYDALTGLPNRSLLQDRLQQALRQAQRQGGRVLVAQLALDRFKLINESAGQETGDAVLKAVADRLAAVVGEQGTLARVGGDEFVLVIPLGEDPEEPARWGIGLQEALSGPVSVAEGEFFVAASAGLALFPGNGSDVATLLRNAETAVHRCKERSPGGYEFFAPAMRETAIRRLSTEAGLRRALERDEFELWYQPQVALADGAMSGLEALLRWRSGEHGLVFPGRFLPMLEQTGLIIPVSEWVLDRACRQLAHWIAAGRSGVRVSVNLSWSHFSRADLLRSVTAGLEDHGVAGEQLGLELTESTLAREPEQAVRLLAALREMGVHLALDDFGTGYSCLSYLKRLPIDTVKIDRSFVQDVTTEPNDATIVRTIIAMSHTLQMSVLAEGVERESQLAFLRREQCDAVQGFYFGKPWEPEEAGARLDGGGCFRLPALSGDGDRTILLVDDEAEVRTALRGALNGDGCRVLEAADAGEALELLAVHPEVRVVIADYRMPRMTGTELLARVRELHPLAVGMVLCADADRDQLADAGMGGPQHRLLTKPWDEHELRAAIGEALARAPRTGT